MAPQPMENNRTVQILRKAHNEGYGVVAQVIYDYGMAVTTVRAAERTKSPAIIQIFPGTLRYGGAPFLRSLLDLAHGASVPISVHMDHAQKDEDITWTLDMAEAGTPLDSIMIDCSHSDSLEENMRKTKGFVARAVALGLATEAELGRLEGGEAGITTASDGQLTDPDVAERFVEETGVQILAPCIGNMHGRYLQEPKFDLDRLDRLNKRLSKTATLICLHGTDDLPDSLFKQCIQLKSTKINVNSWVRDPYLEVIKQGLIDSRPLPEMYEAATEAGVEAAIKMMKVYGCCNKA